SPPEPLKPFGRTYAKPIIASWMGGAGVTAGQAILSRANIPTFEYPDMAARMFTYMWRYTYNLNLLYETPMLPADSGLDRDRAAQMIARTRAAGRTILTEVESKELLSAYGIPVVPTRIAADEAEAVRLADELG